VRRAAILTIAAAYGLSLVAACAALCARPAKADHGCCSSKLRVLAPERDCCAVTPGVTSHGPAVMAMTMAPPPALLPGLLAVPVTPPMASAPVVLAASPPLVLRV
jgi:hypothetical protein